MEFYKNKMPRVALVYDRVNTPFGGAESVIKTLGEMYPEAPLFTSVYSKENANWAKNFKIETTFLQKIKFFRNNHQFIAFLMPIAFESLDLKKFDIIISVSSSEAKGVLTNSNQLHVCYLLTPTRYIYSHSDKYIKSMKILSLPIIRQIANLLLNYLKWWDKTSIFRPDIIIPISQLVKERTFKYYGLKTDAVSYPTIINSKPKIVAKKNLFPFYLSISRLVTYKKIDQSIKAAIKLDVYLVIVGTGLQELELKTIAKNNFIERQNEESIVSLLQKAKNRNKKIIFTKKITQIELNLLLSMCKAVIMPGEEDFGITGLEASIFGKPVIVFYNSGVAEILKNGVNAIFLKKESSSEIIKAIKKVETSKFDSKLIKSSTNKYNKMRFKKEFKNKIIESWNSFNLSR